MDEYINRTKEIKGLEKELESISSKKVHIFKPKEEVESRKEKIQFAIEILKKAEVSKVEPKTDWIATKVKRPEDEKTVNVLTKYGDVICAFHKDGGWWASLPGMEPVRIKDIIAWKAV